MCSGLSGRAIVAFLVILGGGAPSALSAQVKDDHCDSESFEIPYGEYNGRLQLIFTGSGNVNGSLTTMSEAIAGTLLIKVAQSKSQEPAIGGTANVHFWMDVKGTFREGSLIGSNRPDPADQLKLKTSAGPVRVGGRILAEGMVTWSVLDVTGSTSAGNVTIPGVGGGRMPVSLPLVIDRISCGELGGSIDASDPSLQAIKADFTDVGTPQASGTWSVTHKDRDSRLDEVERAVTKADRSAEPSNELIEELIAHMERLRASAGPPRPDGERPSYLECLRSRLLAALTHAEERRVTLLAARFPPPSAPFAVFVTHVELMYFELKVLSLLGAGKPDCGPLTRGKEAMFARIKERLKLADNGKDLQSALAALKLDQLMSALGADPPDPRRLSRYIARANAAAAAKGLPPPFPGGQVPSTPRLPATPPRQPVKPK